MELGMKFNILLNTHTVNFNIATLGNRYIKSLDDLFIFSKKKV